MSRIPNCRTDENYNQKYLSEDDKRELSGFDWCAEMVVDNFFNNIEDYDALDKTGFIGQFLAQDVPEELQEEYTMEYDFDKEEDREEDRKVKTVADYLRYCLLEWIEGERNEMIISMIESMTDEEYEAIKAKVDANE